VSFRVRTKRWTRSESSSEVVASALLADPELRARFQREAESLMRLRHPGVVRVRDAGTARGAPYLVMDLAPGGSLQDRLAKGGPLPPREAARIGAALADALAAAHAAGVVHRDLKPDNVLFDGSGAARLTDFGLARLLDDARRLTRTGDLIGTQGFMAPEQADADHAAVGPRTDVYGLGATLYASLTGRPPHVAATALDTLRKVLNDDPAPPSQTGVALDPELEGVVLRCLARRPADRFPGCAAVGQALREWLEGSGKEIARRRAGPRRGGPFAASAAVLLGGVGLAAAIVALGAGDPGDGAAPAPPGSPVAAIASPATTPEAGPTDPPAPPAAPAPEPTRRPPTPADRLAIRGRYVTLRDALLDRFPDGDLEAALGVLTGEIAASPAEPAPYLLRARLRVAQAVEAEPSRRAALLEAAAADHEAAWARGAPADLVVKLGLDEARRLDRLDDGRWAAAARERVRAVPPPDHPATLVTGARTLQVSGRPARALEWAERALAREPDDRRLRHAALYRAASCRRALGRLDEARAAFDEAAALGPLGGHYSMRVLDGHLLAATGRLAEAEGLYHRAAEAGDAPTGGARLFLVRLLRRTGRDDEARVLARRTLALPDLQPRFRPHLHLELAELARRAGPEAARRRLRPELDAAIRASGPVRIRHALARATLRLGHVKAAADAVAALRRERPGDAAGPYLAALLAVSHGRWPDPGARAEARRLCEAALELDAAHVEARALAATLAADDGRAVAAGEHLGRALDLDPGSAPALVAKGELFLARNDLDTALGAVEQALARDPRSPEARALKGRVLAARGATAEARALLEDVRYCLWDGSREADLAKVALGRLD